MKKKEVTWEDFGEYDKVTEETLGLKRLNEDELNSTRHIIPVIIYVVGFFMSPLIFLYLLVNVGVIIALICTLVLIVILHVDRRYIKHLTKQQDILDENRMKSDATKIKGKIVKVVKYSHFINGNYKDAVYTVFAEFFDDKTNNTQVVKSASFTKDITAYLSSDKVDIYLRPNGEHVVSGFEFRNRDNPKKADIPVEIQFIHEFPSTE